MPIDFPKEKIQAVASTLQANNVSDQDVAKFLDLAGEVLVSRKLMHYKDDPFFEIIEIDTQKTVHFSFRINGSAEEVVDANFDLALLAANSDAPLPSHVHISFRSMP